MKNFGLIGRSLTHSFSKAFFSDKFDNEGIEATYSNFEIDDISAIKKLVSEHSLTGFNVTIPYKEEIIPFLDELSADAQAIGAVNVVHIHHGKWIGYNTDHLGFGSTLLGFNLVDSKALILGTGGASKAVGFALAERGIPFLNISRSGGDLTYDELNEDIIASHHLIVNCTPLGTLGQEDTYPDIPYHAIGQKHLAYDLVYNPSHTEFLKRCEARGARSVNGGPMLTNQALMGWKIWTEMD